MFDRNQSPVHANDNRTMDSSPRFKRGGLDLQWLGWLYIAAALTQAPWFYFFWKFRTLAWEFVQLPVIGWAYGFVMVMMVVLVPQMAWIGTRLIRLSRSSGVRISVETEYQRTQMRNVAVLLALCVVMDILLFAFMVPGAKDEGDKMLFLFGLIGARTCMASMLAVELYHRR